MKTLAAAGLVLAAFTIAPSPVQAQPCLGDCDGDGQVTVDELIRMVSLVLNGGIEQCAQADDDLDGAVTVDEVVLAVNNALRGCDRLLAPGPDLTRIYPPRFKIGSLPIPVAAPVALVAGDLDGDGLLDLATANSGTNNLSLLFQNQSGGFARPRNVRLGASPHALAAADLDGDGLVDLIAADSSTERLWMVSSPYRAAISIPAGTVPGSVVTGDFDGDQRIDLVVGGETSSRLFVLLNGGKGTFAAPRSFEAGARVTALAAGDFDGDARLDIVAAHHENRLSVLLASGDGEFAAPATIDLGQGSAAASAGGRAGDGAEVGSAAGRFGPQHVIGVRVADLNGDGAQDIFALRDPPPGADPPFTPPLSAVVVLLGDGAGGFHSPAAFDTGVIGNAMITADLDGDSLEDVIVGNDAEIVTLHGAGDGSLTLPARWFLGAQARGMAAADLDADGILDVACASPDTDEISILWGHGNRRLAAEELVDLVAMDAVQILTGDFDGNGTVDFASVDSGLNEVRFLLNNDRGEEPLRTLVAADPGLRVAAVGNLDGGGSLDLVTWSSHPLFSINSLLVFEGPGSGHFTERHRLTTAVPVSAITVTDIDRDGRGDIVLRGPTRLSAFRSLGNWTFSEEFILLDRQNNDLALGDLNGDGLPDMVLLSQQPAELLVLLSDGRGGFALHRPVPVPAESIAVRVADLNADAMADVLVALSTEEGGFIQVFPGRGDGTFGGARQTAGIAGRRFELVDVNADGLLDFVTIGSGTTIFPGLAGLTFGAPQTFAGNRAAVDLAVLDVDGDGSIDILTANRSLAGPISVIRGRVR